MINVTSISTGLVTLVRLDTQMITIFQVITSAGQQVMDINAQWDFTDILLQAIFIAENVMILV